jgi:hypothetical protein
VDQNGIVWRIDNGGALSWRAQGHRKAEHEFGEYVMELTTMSDTSLGSSAATVFSGITDEEICDQIDILVAMADQCILPYLPESDVKILRSRLSYLATVAWQKRDGMLLDATSNYNQSSVYVDDYEQQLQEAIRRSLEE